MRTRTTTYIPVVINNIYTHIVLCESRFVWRDPNLGLRYIIGPKHQHMQLKLLWMGPPKLNFKIPCGYSTSITWKGKWFMPILHAYLNEPNHIFQCTFNSTEVSNLTCFVRKSKATVHKIAGRGYRLLFSYICNWPLIVWFSSITSFSRSPSRHHA